MRQNCLWNGDCDHCGADDCIARPTQCIKYQGRDHCNPLDISRACYKEIPRYRDNNGVRVIIHGKTVRFDGID